MVEYRSVELVRGEYDRLVHYLQDFAWEQAKFWSRALESCEKAEDMEFVVKNYEEHEGFFKTLRSFYPERNGYFYVIISRTEWEKIKFFTELYKCNLINKMEIKYF